MVFELFVRNDKEAADDALLCFVNTFSRKLRFPNDQFEIALFDVLIVFVCDPTAEFCCSCVFACAFVGFYGFPKYYDSLGCEAIAAIAIKTILMIFFTR